MVKFESWVAFGSLALGIMFVALLISFYNFLIGIGERGPLTAVDPQGVLVMIVSISAIPSLILAGAVGGLSRSKPARNPGAILIITGGIISGGMIEAWILFTKINKSFVVAGMDVVPIIFIVGGIGIAALGGYLIIASKRARQSFEGQSFESDIL
jgi:hypothetical protein